MIDGAIKMINNYISEIMKNSGPDSYVTDEIIEKAIDDILKISLYKDLEKNNIFDEVSLQHSAFYEDESKMLQANLNHEKWFDPIIGKAYNRDIEWKYWNNYQNYLIEEENFSSNIIHSANGISRTVNKKGLQNSKVRN